MATTASERDDEKLAKVAALLKKRRQLRVESWKADVFLNAESFEVEDMPDDEETLLQRLTEVAKEVSRLDTDQFIQEESMKNLRQFEIMEDALFSKQFHRSNNIAKSVMEQTELVEEQATAYALLQNLEDTLFKISQRRVELSLQEHELMKKKEELELVIKNKKSNQDEIAMRENNMQQEKMISILHSIYSRLILSTGIDWSKDEMLNALMQRMTRKNLDFLND